MNHNNNLVLHGNICCSAQKQQANIHHENKINKIKGIFLFFITKYVFMWSNVSENWNVVNAAGGQPTGIITIIQHCNPDNFLLNIKKFPVIPVYVDFNSDEFMLKTDEFPVFVDLNYFTGKYSLYRLRPQIIFSVLKIKIMNILAAKVILFILILLSFLFSANHRQHMQYIKNDICTR